MFLSLMHLILNQPLLNIGLSVQAAGWFENDLFESTRVQFDGGLHVVQGVHGVLEALSWVHICFLSSHYCLHSNDTLLRYVPKICTESG